MAFADINLAVDRWQVTTSIKTRIMKGDFEMTGIKNYKAETKALNHQRIEDLQA